MMMINLLLFLDCVIIMSSIIILFFCFLLSEDNRTRNYKDTVLNAFETALDAVSVLSGDFAIDKMQTGNSLNSSTTIYHPSHHSIDQEEPHVEENPQAQSQAELLSSVLKAQHGLKDIMASLNQLTEKKKETPAETNVVFKGHLLESSAELTPGRSCPPPSMGRSSPPPSMGRSSPPPPMRRSSPPPSMGRSSPPPSMGRSSPPPSMGRSSPPPSMDRSSPPPTMDRSSPPPTMGRSSSPPPMGHSSPSPLMDRSSPPSHMGHSSPPVHSPMGRSSLPPMGHSSSPMGRPPLPMGCSSPPPIIDRPSSPPPPIPVYNPKTPDRFLLSNKPEYKFEVKKQRHYYEQVELNDDIPNDNETMKVKPVSEQSPQIPLPNLKKRENPIEMERRNFDPLRANKGLPSSGMLMMCVVMVIAYDLYLFYIVHVWKTEQVLKWLKQLNPSFYDKYRDQFCHHDVTG